MPGRGGEQGRGQEVARLLALLGDAGVLQGQVGSAILTWPERVCTCVHRCTHVFARKVLTAFLPNCSPCCLVLQLSADPEGKNMHPQALKFKVSVLLAQHQSRGRGKQPASVTASPHTSFRHVLSHKRAVQNAQVMVQRRPWGSAYGQGSRRLLQLPQNNRAPAALPPQPPGPALYRLGPGRGQQARQGDTLQGRGCGYGGVGGGAMVG